MSTLTVRQSLIANLLNARNDLRVVQVKNPSATEKFKQAHLEELKKQIKKYHPLG